MNNRTGLINYCILRVGAGGWSTNPEKEAEAKFRIKELEQDNSARSWSKNLEQEAGVRSLSN